MDMLVSGGPPCRILIIKWSALGDLVMATALMEDVRRAYPDAVLHLNTMPSFLGLFRHDPRFDEVFAIDVRARGKRWTNALDWLRRVRAGRYDLIIDLQRTDHTRALLGLLCVTGGAPRHLLGNRGGLPYTQTPTITDPGAHAFPMMRSVLESAGIPAFTPHPVLHAGSEHEERSRLVMTEMALVPGHFAVFLPGSQAAGWLKRWGVDRFRELAHMLREAGMIDRIAVIGGPDEVDDCARICRDDDFIVNLNGRLHLLEIAPISAHAAFVVANDTGTAHIAAAADRPMLVICGATDPGRVKPIGRRVRGIQADLPCKSCYAKDCLASDRLACMRNLTPAFVVGELKSMLDGVVNPTLLPVAVIRVY